MIEPSEPSVLLVCRGKPETGYGRVALGLLPALAGNRRLVHLSRDLETDCQSEDWIVCGNRDPADPFGVGALAVAMARFAPAAVIIHDDPWRVIRYLDLLSESSHRAQAIVYLPVDGLIRDAAPFVEIAGRAAIVVANSAVRSELERALGEALGAGATAPIIGVVPTPVDTRHFFPLDHRRGRAEARRVAFERGLLATGRNICDDAFIVLNASRNQARKRLDITLKGFAEFAQDNAPNAMLWLHTARSSPLGWKVEALAAELGINDRLLLTGTTTGHPEVSVEDLNIIFNACDVGINTAMGETWGLAAFEHAATGAPQVLPGDQVQRELWPSGALLIDVEPPTPMGAHLDGRCPSIRGVGEALKILYADPVLRARMGQDAKANACRPEFQARHIAALWNKILTGFLQPRNEAV